MQLLEDRVREAFLKLDTFSLSYQDLVTISFATFIKILLMSSIILILIIYLFSMIALFEFDSFVASLLSIQLNQDL